MDLEHSFKSFCRKLGGSFSKKDSDQYESYFCHLTTPQPVDGILFGRKADQEKYKVFLVHFGRKKVLELDFNYVNQLEVKIDDIPLEFLDSRFNDTDQYVVYSTPDIQLIGVEMVCEKESRSCRVGFIAEVE